MSPLCSLLLLTALTAQARGDSYCGEVPGVWCDIVQTAYFNISAHHDNITISSNTGRSLDEIIVSLADTDGDNEVNFDELRDFSEIYLNKGFNSIDLDGDSGISDEEAVSAVTRVNFGMIEDIILELFNIADSDKDEKVSTWDLPSELRRNLDKDYDGTVSLKELLGHPIIFFPGPVQTVYKILDSDKDEAVSKRELTNFLKFLSSIFNVFDVDLDCFVTLDEALVSLQKAGLGKEFQLAMEVLFRPLSALGRYVALTVIEDMDADTDSRLTMAEILQFSRQQYFEKFHTERQRMMLRETYWAIDFLAGRTGFNGQDPASPEAEKRLFNRALANGLSAFQVWLLR